MTWLRPNIPTRVGAARVAAGNIWDSSAQLWVMDPDPALQKNFRVEAGQEFEVTGARVRVLLIADEGVEIDVEVSEELSRPG
jgi:hypothetical protein